MSGHVLPRPLARPRRAEASTWLGWLAVILRTIETRRELARLDDRMLRDIGLSRAEAKEEAERAPWDFAETTPRRRR